MKLLFGFLAIFLAISFGEGAQNSAKLTGPIPCSTNASETWVDVVLLIDNSVNMGSSNLRKISTLTSLVMSKFPIGTNPNVTQGVHNTRVGVIAYNYKASIVAGFDDIKNLNDLAQVLNGIQLSSHKEANLYDAIIQSNFLEAPCTVNFCVSTYRPTVMIFFAAASNVDANSQIVHSNLIDTVTTTIITVNFNSADSNITSLLNTLTFNYFVNTSMYNYSSNCYCIDHTGYPLILYDSANNRYTRYAECMILLWTNGQIDGYYENPIEACTSIGYFPNYVMTGFLNSKDEEQFLAGIRLF
uniref:VWFA domain-containing protein n=1 Tax=Acrobeloides nanus TaxID=290746 RepID=A0A914CQ10_9BILA